MSSRPPPASTSASASRAADLNPRFSPQPSASPPAQQQQHRRGYQACDPCRRRKVRCDLGSVDNPRPPPCVRCRRESKRCEFSATRRKRKLEDSDDGRPTTEVLRRDQRVMSSDTTVFLDSEVSSAALALAADRNRSIEISDPTAQPQAVKAETGPSPHRQWTAASPNSQSYTTAGGPPVDYRLHQHHPHRSSFSSNGRGFDAGQHMMNKTAADLLSPAISNTHDALHLLSEAAGRTEDLNRRQIQDRYAANTSAQSPAFTSSLSPMGHVGTPGHASRSSSSVQHGPSTGWYDQRKAASGGIDRVVQTQDSGVSRTPKASEEVECENPRRVWSRLRFIRAGWFSVDEAMGYIAYYYEHLAPLSPIVLPDFSSPSTHLKLLMEEPVLSVTMLTIASRHMKLTGNGANSRAYSIHEKLWSYLRGMIERLFWGQEKFGNSGYQASPSKPRQFTLSDPPSSGNADFNGHLRSVGTVEALLLLTDWHPRALHFPPGDDENTLLDMDSQLLAQINASNVKEDDKAQTESRPGFHKWLEPVWRSDRMSWMLLSTAQALAFELGVFDHKNDLKASTESPAEQARKRRVRRLILVYVSQSSGRLGIPSMLPLPQWNQNIDPIESGNGLSREDYATEMMQGCWMDISKIMHVTNQELFLSKEHTSNLIKSGRYRERIDEFMPSLHEFKQKLDRLGASFSPHMRYILSIEYEYTRLYVNCLALQAVVDRWTTITNEAGSSSLGQNQAGGPTGPLRLLLEQYEVNEPYIQEVVDASRKILQTVLDGLVPGGYLKHTPVRTFFRILSGMIFILKTFTLGAKEDDVRISLDLQDRTVEALRSCVVDDVHLSVTIADLLQLLTANIRTRFLRFAPSDRLDQALSRERSPVAVASPQARQQENSGDYRWPNQQNQPGTASATNFPFDGTSTPATNDPLADIPAQPINASNLNVSFMPPPPSVYYNYYDLGTSSPKMDSSPHPDNSTSGAIAANTISSSGPNTSNGQTNGNSNTATMSDWFALPLDQFFNSSTAGVDQGLGGTGPMVGEFDMLEVLLKEQYTMNDPTGTNGQYM